MTSRRQLIDGPLDRVRLLLDRYPNDYQPLPWQTKRSGAPRAEATFSRWREMASVLDEFDSETALDIGANVGWFSFALARRDIQTMAVERHAPYFRTILYAKKKLDEDRVSLLVESLDQKTVGIMPSVDVVLFLAVWHHVVREHGMDTATLVIEEIWARSLKVMFFETGEEEMPKEFGLPDMGGDPGGWIAQFLADNCEGGKVELLGTHPAIENCGGGARHLFAVRR
jgi:hypothetical protein